MTQTPTTSTERFLTSVEVAGVLRLSKRFVLDELRAKNLVGHRIGGAWRIYPADLDRYIKAHANVAPVRGRA